MDLLAVLTEQDAETIGVYKMRYEDAWIWQDKITSTVNALGYTIWDLKYNRDADYFHLELNETLTDDKASMLCAQMSLPTDYDGIGDIGSCFTIYT